MMGQVVPFSQGEKSCIIASYGMPFAYYDKLSLAPTTPRKGKNRFIALRVLTFCTTQKALQENF